MNCCNAWGQCDQGPDCPAGPAKPITSHATSAAQMAMHLDGSNVWFADDAGAGGPPTPEIEPLSVLEKFIFIGSASVLCLCSAALLALSAGYVWTRWLA